MRRVFLCFFFVIGLYSAQAQQDCVDNEEPFVAAEQMPEFPGGISELSKYLGKSIKLQQNCLEGRRVIAERIVISFVVSKTGDVCGGKVEGMANCPEAVEQIRQVLQDMPRWKPGMQSGRAVAVRYSCHISLHPVSPH